MTVPAPRSPLVRKTKAPLPLFWKGTGKYSVFAYPLMRTRNDGRRARTAMQRAVSTQFRHCLCNGGGERPGFPPRHGDCLAAPFRPTLGRGSEKRQTGVRPLAEGVKKRERHFVAAASGVAKRFVVWQFQNVSFPSVRPCRMSCATAISIRLFSRSITGKMRRRRQNVPQPLPIFPRRFFAGACPAHLHF